MLETDHTLYLLQNYWWILISILGGALVVLLFVQGGQSFLLNMRSDTERALTVTCLGKKWELTFTTLVVFGGAFFASFPLFYSTSFGGAYWLWILILFSFVLQAVSYEFRSKPGNFLGTRTYDTFLFMNGLVGCVLLGVAVSMFFFGAEFTVSRGNLLDTSAPVISRWAPTHGWEAIFNWKNLVLGVAVFFLARTLAAMYLLRSISGDTEFTGRLRNRVFVNGGIFLVFFLWFLGMLLISDGYSLTATSPRGDVFSVEPYRYLHNYIELPWAAVALLLGVSGVLFGYIRTIATKSVSGFWWAAGGTFLVVASLFWVAGFNYTPYLPSITDPGSSLTIRNSSSTRFTLEVMSWVSLVIPVVVAYIAYAWRALARHRLTPADVAPGREEY